MNRHYAVGKSDHLLTCVGITEGWPGTTSWLCVCCSATCNLEGILGWVWMPLLPRSFIKSWVAAALFGTGLEAILPPWYLTILWLTTWEQWHHFPRVKQLCSPQHLDQKPGQEAIAVETLWTWLNKVLQSRSSVTREIARSNGNQDSAWPRVSKCIYMYMMVRLLYEKPRYGNLNWFKR